MNDHDFVCWLQGYLEGLETTESKSITKIVDKLKAINNNNQDFKKTFTDKAINNYIGSYKNTRKTFCPNKIYTGD